MKLRTHLVGAATIAIALAYGAMAQAADKPVFGVLLKTLSNPFWGAMEKGIHDGADAAGVEYFMQAVESDQAAEPQLNTCNTMLERKPAVMITAAINSTILLPCLKQATDSRIAVVDLDANLDHAIAAEAGVKIAFTIGSDNVAAATPGADWLAGTLGKAAKGPVLSIKAGRLNASVAQLPYLVGKQAVEKAKADLGGAKADEYTYVPTLVLTKQVLEENKEPMLQYVK